MHGGRLSAMGVSAISTWEIAMSIRVMSRVWENSSARGGDLLVLLAIADHADDRGRAWPGIDLLARKSRLTARHVTRCLNNLVAAGELQIQNNRGPKGTNLYQVLCFHAPDKMSALPTISRDDIPCQGDRCLPQMSPEPSEPSEPPTHTIDATVIADNASEWPTEEEVIRHAQAYPGNMAIGVPAKAITREWASDYWSWRTFDEERWPKRWREELVRRFEREWRNGGPAARGIHKKNSARDVTERSPGGPPSPVKSCAVTLADMRRAVD